MSYSKLHMRKHHRRGTAMVEFVMCIPLLALLLSAIYFFGWSMQNAQRVRIADRYTAWRETHNLDAQADAQKHSWIKFGEPDEDARRANFVTEYTKYNVIEVTKEHITDTYFGPKSENTKIKSDAGSKETIHNFVDDAEGQDADAGDLARRSALVDFPRGEGDRVSADFLYNMKGWDKFTRGNTNMSSYHCRDGVQWRRWQTSYLEPVRALFLAEWDQVVDQVKTQQLRENLKRMYLRTW